MPRTITLGAAQTGPVNEDDWRPNVPGACAMIEEAGRRKVDILCFSELFLTPFFPNRLTRDYDKFFVTLEEPELAPIFKTAVDSRVALVFPFGEKNARHYHNACLVTDKNGKRLGIYRKTHIPAILPSTCPAEREATRSSISRRASSFRFSIFAARRLVSRSATTANTRKARAC